jgi:hypothetical protein
MGASGEQADEESIVPFEYLFRIIRRRLAIILVSVVLLTGFVVGFDLFRMPVYEAFHKCTDWAKADNGQFGGSGMGLQAAYLYDARPLKAAALLRRLSRNWICRYPEAFLENLSAEGY